MIDNDSQRIEAMLNQQTGKQANEEETSAAPAFFGFNQREVPTLVPYLDWIVKVDDSRLYFMQGTTLKVKFILEFGKRVQNLIVDDVSREDLFVDIELGPFQFVCHKLNILRDIPGYIPRNLLEVENAVGMYNMNRPDEIRYFENARKMEDYQILGTLQIRRAIAYEKEGLFNTEQRNIQSMLQYIEANPLNEVLSYNITYRSHILKTVSGYKNFQKIFDVLDKKFSLSTPDELPFLTPDMSYLQLSSGAVPETAFDIALGLEDQALSNTYLTTMLSEDTTGHMYSEICDRNLIKVAQLGIDLKPYFESQLAYHALSDEYHEGSHGASPDTYFIPVQNFNNLNEIQLNINQIESDDQKQASCLSRVAGMFKSAPDAEGDKIGEEL